MDPGAVQVGRKLGDGYVQNPVQVIGAVVLGWPTVVAYGPQAGRRWQTSIWTLKAIVRKWIVMV